MGGQICDFGRLEVKERSVGASQPTICTHLAGNFVQHFVTNARDDKIIPSIKWASLAMEASCKNHRQHHKATRPPRVCVRHNLIDVGFSIYGKSHNQTKIINIIRYEIRNSPARANHKHLTRWKTAQRRTKLTSLLALAS